MGERLGREAMGERRWARGLGCDVKNGDVFIFINGERKLMKLLHAEDGGLVMYVKRLEAGRFRLPQYDANYEYQQIATKLLSICT